MFNYQKQYWSDFFESMDKDTVLLSQDYMKSFDMRTLSFTKSKKPTKKMKRLKLTTNVSPLGEIPISI